MNAIRTVVGLVLLALTLGCSTDRPEAGGEVVAGIKPMTAQESALISLQEGRLFHLADRVAYKKALIVQRSGAAGPPADVLARIDSLDARRRALSALLHALIDTLKGADYGREVRPGTYLAHPDEYQNTRSLWFTPGGQASRLTLGLERDIQAFAGLADSVVNEGELWRSVGEIPLGQIPSQDMYVGDHPFKAIPTWRAFVFGGAEALTSIQVLRSVEESLLVIEESVLDSWLL